MDFLKAISGDSTAVLGPKYNDESLLFLGSSVEASVLPGYKGRGTITFVPPEEKKVGLIALYFSGIRNGHFIKIPFFIKIELKESKPYIHLKDQDTPWIPPADKLAQITDNENNDSAALAVKIDEIWYSTSENMDGYRALPVSAGNLICEYLVSEGDKSKVLAEKIKEKAKEKTEKEDLLIRAKKELARVEYNYKRKEEKLERVLNTISNIKTILLGATFWNKRNTIEKIEKELIKGN